MEEIEVVVSAKSAAAFFNVKVSRKKSKRLDFLRHSHASLLIAKLGAQPNLIAERLGHEKIQTTLSAYAHLYPNQARNLADQLNGLMDCVDDEEEGNSNARAT